MLSAIEEEFPPDTRYLDTATHCLLPARTSRLLGEAVAQMAEGEMDHGQYAERFEAVRAAYAGLVGLPAARVALGSSVAAHVGLVASSLPAGTEVLVAEGDFASLVSPFWVRKDLTVRTAPLGRLAEHVDPRTALVAVSAVQSADGRVADLHELVRAARAHGARTLIDTTQSAGWLPLDTGRFDYTVTGAYKWLLCPRGTSFLTVPEDGGELRPLYPSWTAAARPWGSTYGPVTEFADSARRFDAPVPYLPYLGALPSLRLVEEVGPVAVGEHNRALAARLRSGLDALGHPCTPGDSAIVCLPGAGEEAAALAERAGVRLSVRAGNLRAAVHLYNTAADVDRLLNVLEELPTH